MVPCNCSECTGSENPYTYPLEELRKRLDKGKFEIECRKSYEMVDVGKLINDVFPPQQQEIPSTRQLPKSRGEILKEFRNAMLDAYRNKINLEMMVSDKLNQNLDSIAGGENIEEIVFNLIKWAESQSKLKQLVQAAREYNPGNTKLQNIDLGGL